MEKTGIYRRSKRKGLDYATHMCRYVKCVCVLLCVIAVGKLTGVW